jgi:ubiquitin carboxyl-terminal hydrolase 22/27/51
MIKRFEHLKEAQTSSKIATKVQFPLQFNMLPYTTRARCQDTRENFELARSCTYDLLSVVVHFGTINTGKLVGSVCMYLALILQVTIFHTHGLEIRYVLL